MIAVLSKWFLRCLSFFIKLCKNWTTPPPSQCLFWTNPSIKDHGIDKLESTPYVFDFTYLTFYVLEKNVLKIYRCGPSL